MSGVDLLPHIMDIKDMQARLDTRLERVETAVVGADGESGLQGRVTTLEHDKTGRSAISGFVTTVAGLVGGIAGATLTLFRHGN